MRFACQSCGKAYSLADEKIATSQNVKLKCRVCGALVEVKNQGVVVAQLLPPAVTLERLSEAPEPLLPSRPPPSPAGASPAGASPAQPLVQTPNSEPPPALVVDAAPSAPPLRAAPVRAAASEGPRPPVSSASTDSVSVTERVSAAYGESELEGTSEVPGLAPAPAVAWPAPLPPLEVPASARPDPGHTSLAPSQPEAFEFGPGPRELQGIARLPRPPAAPMSLAPKPGEEGSLAAQARGSGTSVAGAASRRPRFAELWIYVVAAFVTGVVVTIVVMGLLRGQP